MPCAQGRDEKYSSATGVIFLFNLIVGTGALALPGALQKAGYLLGLVLLLVLALFSFITVTFIVESLAAANALTRLRCDGGQILNEEAEHSVEETPLVSQQQCQECNIFEITEKYEIGQMGVLISPGWCQFIIYFSLCIYLFGDAAIYAVVIGRSVSHVLCSYRLNSTYPPEILDDLPCWDSYSITRINVYRLIVLCFILLLGPFVFSNLQKTKMLQIATSIMRWLAFFIMFTWSMYKLYMFGAEGNPPVGEFKSLPTLFGTLVYSFMCQHSVPGLLQPISNKKHLKAIIGLDFALVSIFYLALALTAVFAFVKVQDIYTLNFWEESTKPGTSELLKFLAFFLALFPIFSISTNFPIIAITLKNNLRYLIVKDAPACWFYDTFLFPLLAILPPAVLAMTISDILFLVGIVGSYAGACVQYLIPCLLVFFARSRTKDFDILNIYASPFKKSYWIYTVYVWMVLSLFLITINYTATFK